MLGKSYYVSDVEDFLRKKLQCVCCISHCCGKDAGLIFPGAVRRYVQARDKVLRTLPVSAEVRGQVSRALCPHP